MRSIFEQHPVVVSIYFMIRFSENRLQVGTGMEKAAGLPSTERLFLGATSPSHKKGPAEAGPS